VNYACFLPLLCFGLAILSAGYGFLTFTSGVTPLFFTVSLSLWFFGVFSTTFILIGILFISNTLIKINEAATKPESLSTLRLSFASGSTAEKFAAGQRQPVGFILQNLGKELGEKITASIYFPDEFGEVTPGLSGGPLQIPQVTVIRQPILNVITYPNRTTASVVIADLYDDMAVTFAANITMPASAGSYRVPAYVWERRLGKSEQELTFEITR